MLGITDELDGNFAPVRVISGDEYLNLVRALVAKESYK